MNIKQIGFSVLAATLLSATAQASTFKNDRGYKVCEQTLTKTMDLPGVTFERHYTVKQSGEKRTFFINKMVWNDAGERAPMTATCVTSQNGRDVLNLDVDMGSHAAVEDILAAR